MKEQWIDLDASMLMELTFFVPEKMSTWDALQVIRTCHSLCSRLSLT